MKFFTVRIHAGKNWYNKIVYEKVIKNFEKGISQFALEYSHAVC